MNEYRSYCRVTIAFGLLYLGCLTFYVQKTSAKAVPLDEHVYLAQNQQQQSSRSAGGSTNPFNEALQLAKAGKYQQASVKLFQLSYSPSYRDKRMQIKYLLGLMLYQMKLSQVAAFQFISVIKEGNNKYVKPSLEKLSLAANNLGDDTLLNYAISRARVDDFPRVHRDMLMFRVGEFQMRNKQFGPATQSLQRVQTSSPYFVRAKYLEGLAHAEQNKIQEAIAAFDDLIASREGAGVTDPGRVAGLMGKARALYQGKKWDQAIENYREVPRDTPSWHDTIFESSWAMLRTGRFRSALSNFHSLHSTYYEDFYLPESLLLRSIVYLYICKYQEMDKVLVLFNKIYKPVFKQTEQILAANQSPVTLFNEVIRVLRDSKIQGDKIDRSSYKIPFVVVRKILKEGDFQNSYNYITKLLAERKAIQALPVAWRQSALGKYAVRVVNTRLLKARQRAGRQIRIHLESVRDELIELFEQEGFVRYEMISGKKESLKKKIAGKELPVEQVDDSSSRDFYIQNGFEYWPFTGEYWLDELGNYHYVGTQACQ